MRPELPPRYLAVSERQQRRAAARAKARRRRWITVAAVVLVISGIAATALTLRGGAARPHASAQASTQARHGGTTTVQGSKANEVARRGTVARTISVATTTSPATSSVAALTSLRGKTIAVDPGHNGANYAHTSEINQLVDAGTLRKPCDTTGTETNNHYTEAAYNLDVALRLATLLRRAGARVVLTRTTNGGWGPCINERAAICNRAHADAAISIHADGGPASGRGFHVIYPPSIKGLTDDIAAASLRLALDVRGAYAKGTGMPYATYLGHSGLDERSDLGGLNLSNVPKVFIETGNMRNATDAALLTSSAYRERAARALEAGLAKFVSGA